MKEEKLTLDNYWYHPRFWRHSAVWLLVFSISLISDLIINPLYRSLNNIVVSQVISLFLYVICVYSSFYLYECFYKQKKYIVFFLCHIPIFITGAVLGRVGAFCLNISYPVDIWMEIINWPVSMGFIYLIKFGYSGLKKRWELNKLKSQFHQTAYTLKNTQIDPQYLIKELKQIHQDNLQNTALANETILELSDRLRQRIDTSRSEEISTKINTTPLLPITTIQKGKSEVFSSRVKRHLFAWLVLIIILTASFWNRHSGSFIEFALTFPKKIPRILLYAFLIYPSIHYYKKWLINKKHLQFIFTQIVILFCFPGFALGLRYILLGSKVPDGTLITLLLGSCIVLLGAYLIQISYNFFRDSSTVQTLGIKQTETELKLLKAQINPHFLFNVLNNIYGTNLDNSSKANEYLQGLINLLQYQSNSQKKTFIDLKEEIQLVKSYIELEKARVYNCNVTITEKGSFSDFKVIPLLLLPIIENAFKYGTGVEKGDIHITFEQINNQFNFTCSNTIQSNKKQQKSTGIGIDNVQKRLAIKYPKKHKFTIDRTQKIFTAKITITL